jgi:membrane-bound lytic murein transglycosylase D
LRLPQTAVNTFIDSGDSLYVYKQDEYFNHRTLVEVDEAAKPKATGNGKAAYHKVRKGDTLGSIAKRYGVSVAQIRRLNRIKGNNIAVGKSLRVK